MKYSWLVVLFLIFTGTAHAETAGELKTDCLATNVSEEIATKNQLVQAGVCVGYINGATEMLSSYYIDLPGADVPGTYADDVAPGVTIEQAIRAFLMYIGKHPEREKELAPYVLRDAMGAAGLITESRVSEKPRGSGADHKT